MLEVKELTPQQLKRIIGSAPETAVPATPQGLAAEFGRVTRDEITGRTDFRMPSSRPGIIDTIISVPDKSTTLVRAQGAVHVIDWRGAEPRGVLVFPEQHLAPRQRKP